jgi:Glycosyl transferase family 2/Sulfotransferase family
MRVLISGIGRSGTTMVYQQIGRMMREAFRAPRYRYEPYLWNLNISYASESSWEQADLSPFGMHAHQATPLFLSGAHPVHDEFLDRALGHEARLPGDPESPDSWLVKIIRGNGRLESYLRRYADLKVVICLRNPIDTLNSSLGMFSFTGEEFHRSDAPRLLTEVGERLPHIELPPAGKTTILATSAVWWRAFTEWAVRVAEAFPDRCHLFVHDSLATNQQVEAERLAEFLGFSSAETFKSGIDGPAGLKTSKSYLLTSDIADLDPHLSYYLNCCIRSSIPLKERQSLRVSLLQRYAERPFSPQLAGDALGRRTSLQLRNAAHGSGIDMSRYVSRAIDDKARVPLYRYAHQFAARAGLSLGAYKAYAQPSTSRRSGFTFGCCISSRNNQETIRDAIYSALDQTLPFEKIAVVDDASTDGSRGLLEELASRYSRLTVHFSEHKGGGLAARDVAIRTLGTRFVTTLDGKDCFWPTKNREEAEVCFDSPSAIAFSPTMHDYNERRSEIVDASRYGGPPEAIYAKLLGRAEGMPRGPTMSLQSYLEAGGYDPSLSLFEGWDLNLRLAKGQAEWKMSASRIGTVYNCRRPRSGSSEIEITRGLTHVFLKAALQTPRFPALAERYLQATKPRTNAVSKPVAAMLALCDGGHLQISALACIIGPVFAIMPNDEYAQGLAALAETVASDKSGPEMTARKHVQGHSA